MWAGAVSIKRETKYKIQYMKKIVLVTLAGWLVLAVLAVGAYAEPVFQMRLVVSSPTEDSVPMVWVTQNGDNTFTNVLNVQKTVLLDGTAVKSAKMTNDPMGHPEIYLNLTDEGAKKFAEVTRQNLHQQLAILVDGRVCTAPIIHAVIPAGEIQINGVFSKREAKDMVRKINDALKK
jgi:preprotein translocase subunit SecD